MPTKTSTSKRKPQGDVAFDVMKRQYAEKRGKDVTSASKSLRQAIRTHRAELEKHWPSLSDHGKGDSYRPVPRKLANLIVSEGVTGALAKIK